jgi:carboxylesterase
MTNSYGIIPGAEPFDFKGDGAGCLLIHGFTGTPSEMRWMGTQLAADGRTVLGIRLAGHGTSPEDMNTTRWHDWYETVHAGYRRLRAECDRVFAVGLSLGGVLGLHLAALEPVDGLVTMASPVHLSDWRLTVFRPFQRLIPYWRSNDAVPPPGAEQQTTDAAFASTLAYDRMPTSCILSMLDLFKQVDRELPRVTVPILFVYSSLDRLAPQSEARYIHGRIASADKRLVMLERSGHVVCLGVERETVLAETRRFISSRTNDGEDAKTSRRHTAIRP